MPPTPCDRSRLGPDSARQMQMSVFEDAANGVFSRQVIREQVITNRDGTTRVVQTLETIDDSGLPVFGATLLNGWFRPMPPKRCANERPWRWRTPDWKPGSNWWGSKRFARSIPIIESIQGGSFSHHTARQRRQPPGEIRGGQRVGDHTHRCHPFRGPCSLHDRAEPTVLQVYFIPRWEVGQALQLPTAVVRNIKTREFELGRPTAANPAGDHPDSRASERRPWLAARGHYRRLRNPLLRGVAATRRDLSVPLNRPKKVRDGKSRKPPILRGCWLWRS